MDWKIFWQLIGRETIVVVHNCKCYVVSDLLGGGGGGGKKKKKKARVKTFKQADNFGC